MRIDGHRAFAVQRGRGLVGQDHRRVVHQAARDGHSLLLAARELRGHGACTVLHVQRGRAVPRARCACLRIRHAGQHGQQRDVVGDVEEGNQVGRLEDEADAVAPQCAQVVDAASLRRRSPSSPRVMRPPRGVDDRTEATSASVLLPEPEGPISPTTSPGATSMLTPLSASTAVSPLP
jgi:hypothetical protein